MNRLIKYSQPTQASNDPIHPKIPTQIPEDKKISLPNNQKSKSEKHKRIARLFIINS